MVTIRDSDFYGILLPAERQLKLVCGAAIAVAAHRLESSGDACAPAWGRRRGGVLAAQLDVPILLQISFIAAEQDGTQTRAPGSSWLFDGVCNSRATPLLEHHGHYQSYTYFLKVLYIINKPKVEKGNYRNQHVLRRSN